MPLFMANPGDLVKVKRVTGQDDVRRHLAELGFVEDAEVLVVSNIEGRYDRAGERRPRRAEPFHGEPRIFLSGREFVGLKIFI